MAATVQSFVASSPTGSCVPLCVDVDFINCNFMVGKKNISIAPSKLLEKLVPGSVPGGELNFIVTDDSDRRENLRLCIDSAKKVGCDVSKVDIAAILQLKV